MVITRASTLFTPDGDSIGAKVCVFERDKMLATTVEERQGARMKCFDPTDESGQAVRGVLPADIDGARMPPQGSPEYVLGFELTGYCFGISM
jgi:hypothetical protein